MTITWHRCSGYINRSNGVQTILDDLPPLLPSSRTQLAGEGDQEATRAR